MPAGTVGPKRQCYNEHGLQPLARGRASYIGQGGAKEADTKEQGVSSLT